MSTMKYLRGRFDCFGQRLIGRWFQVDRRGNVQHEFDVLSDGQPSVLAGDRELWVLPNEQTSTIVFVVLSDSQVCSLEIQSC